jgi:predicted nucleotidyltransferase
MCPRRIKESLTILEILKKKYTYLSDEFCVEKIGVFGSAAREDEREDSDIDIIVSLREPIGFKFIGLIEYLENLFHKKVDVLTEAGINNIRIKEVSDAIKRNIIYV